MDRAEAERLGFDAASGRIPLGSFIDAVKKMNNRELEEVALSAYCMHKTSGSPNGYYSRSGYMYRHVKTPAHKPSGEWRTDYPKA